METLSVIAGLLIFVVWGVAIIGLINPKWLQGKKENSKLMTRKEIGLGTLGATILLGIIGVVTSPAPASTHGNIQKEIVSANAIDSEKNADSENLKIDYVIISDDKKRNITRKVSVELPERISEQQLRQIANEIKNGDSNDYERTFIMYRIKDEQSVAAWATTHFDPNLEVKFIGLSSDNFKKLLNVKYDVDGEVIGQWISPNGFTDHIVVFYKKDKKYFNQDFYIDATLKPYELLKDGTTYRYKDLDETQYFIIDSHGDLEYHGESGNIYIAKKLEK